jgi:hypothetical protein
MKLISPTVLAALAVTLLNSSAVFAEDTVRRIDHPNGPATYVTVPSDARGFAWNESSGVFAGDRSFGWHDRALRSDAGMNDREGRTLLPIHRGRGQTLHAPVER